MVRVLQSVSNSCQAGEEAEARAAAAAQAASLAQKDVQLQQLEVMKARIRADRYVAKLRN